MYLAVEDEEHLVVVVLLAVGLRGLQALERLVSLVVVPGHLVFVASGLQVSVEPGHRVFVAWERPAFVAQGLPAFVASGLRAFVA